MLEIVIWAVPDARTTRPSGRHDLRGKQTFLRSLQHGWEQESLETKNEWKHRGKTLTPEYDPPGFMGDTGGAQ